MFLAMAASDVDLVAALAKWRKYISVVYGEFYIYDVPRFWVHSDACAVGVYQAFFWGPGDEAKSTSNGESQNGHFRLGLVWI